MLLIIAIVWEDIKGYFFGGSGVAIILWVLNYFKDRPKDKVGNDKTEAETRKVEAEAYKIKSDAEVTVADTALKIARQISEDFMTVKAELLKAQGELEETRVTLRQAHEKLAAVENRLNGELQSALLRERELQDVKEELEELKAKHKND